MATYTVTFDRVGRRHDVEPLVVQAADAFELAEHIHRHVRSHLLSTFFEVITGDEGPGQININGRNAGTFTVSFVEDEPDGAPCCPDPECNGNPCTFPGYSANH
jgi:hypothetical protein